MVLRKRRKNPPSVSVEPAGHQSTASVAAAASSSSSISFASRDWASLPNIPLLEILRRQDTLKDFFTFRGVCRSWRHAADPNPYTLAGQPPLLLFNRAPGFTEVYCDAGRGCLYGARFSWRVASRRSIAYSQGYLVISGGRRVTKLLLWNIFTGAMIRLPKVPESFDHVVFSSRPSYHGCLALLFKRGKAVLQYLQIGSPLWKVANSCEPLNPLSDMIFFKKKFYALTADYRLIAVDLVGQPKYEVLGGAKDSKQLAISGEELLDIDGMQLKWRLAVSGEELLAICYKPVRRCYVFLWDFTKNDWVEKLTLDGRALFMGASGFVGSVVASQTNFKGDRIHSLDCSNGEWSEFSLKDQTVKVANPILPGIVRGQAAAPPVWFYLVRAKHVLYCEVVLLCNIIFLDILIDSRAEK